jgi:hypothetical protein
MVLAQQIQSFAISLQAPVTEATPLFGPVREAEWAVQWVPHFVNPAEGAQEEGWCSRPKITREESESGL